jgi:hypothetical protein
MSETASENGSACGLAQEADFTGVTIAELAPEPPLNDYLQAMDMANAEAQRRLGDHMLLSWYDRDRDFESPQHAGECHSHSAVPGYVDYALYRGATLKIDIEGGRFVFFYLNLEL